jgi:hypothetical protein
VADKGYDRETGPTGLIWCGAILKITVAPNRRQRHVAGAVEQNREILP